jgi:hypothetical protein
MGTHSVIAGLSPAIALTLEALDVDLGGVATAIGLENALESLGLSVTRNDTRKLDARVLEGRSERAEVKTEEVR